jgi:CRISPR-associated protein Cmr4
MSSYSRALIIIRALSLLHVGAGRGESFHVDLPVQRDEFGFPTIWASSLKGALRANFTGDNCVKRVLFGPEPGTEEASKFSSALSFTDARLILVPGRTLKGIWTYMTSPHMISELYEYVDRDISKVKKPSSSEVFVSSKDLIINNKVILNELDFDPSPNEFVNIDDLFGGLLNEELLRHVKSRGLVLVSDDVIRQLVNKSMLIQYRIRLKRDTKTVESGGLWSEEYIPSETIFASLVIAKRSKGCETTKEYTADQVLEEFTKFYSSNPVIFVGGKETIGRGLVRLYINKLDHTQTTSSQRI